MKLHYSQTELRQYGGVSCFSTLWNYTTLKLILTASPLYLVSVPYEITLLSNNTSARFKSRKVSVPYEITLLSNGSFCLRFFIIVSVPYEITLLSNASNLKKGGLRVSVPYEITLLSNRTPFSPRKGASFSTLWNYTTLKPTFHRLRRAASFSTLWNYTTLKRCFAYSR